MSTNAEKLVKFGPVLAEIFGGICRFFAISELPNFYLFRNANLPNEGHFVNFA